MKPTTEQQAVIDSDEKHMLVLAGPGSGKTATLIERLKRLLAAGVHPKEIAVITYTNEASREIQERMPHLGGAPVEFGFAGTVHAFCLRHLAHWSDTQNLTVLDEEEADEELARCAREINCTTSMAKLKEIRKVWQTEGIINASMHVANIAVANYFRRLEGAGMIDYDTILHRALFELTMAPDNQKKFKHLIVDEFHDANAVDFRIFALIAAENRLFVGDPNQAIFGFRGDYIGDVFDALVNNKHWVKYPMTGNFRCAVDICAAANLIVGRTVTVSRRDITGKVELHVAETDMHEPGLVANLVFPCEEPDKVAVLARTRKIATRMADDLTDYGVPVARAEAVLPADWKTAKAAVRMLVTKTEGAIARWLRVSGRSNAANWIQESELGHLSLHDHFFKNYGPEGLSSVNGSFLSAFNLSLLGVNLESIGLITDITEQLPVPTSDETITLAVTSYRAAPERAFGVFVGTIHAAKGREWDTVVLAGFEESVIPGRSRRDLREEQRIAYVGATRARNRLIFTRAATRENPWNHRLESAEWSRFVTDIGASAFAIYHP